MRYPCPPVFLPFRPISWFTKLSTPTLTYWYRLQRGKITTFWFLSHGQEITQRCYYKTLYEIHSRATNDRGCFANRERAGLRRLFQDFLRDVKLESMNTWTVTWISFGDCWSPDHQDSSIKTFLDERFQMHLVKKKHYLFSRMFYYFTVLPVQQ